MKATKIFMMAALALTFAACSNNDDIDLAQQPTDQPANGEITITATLDANDGASTRALSIDGSNIASTWETTDQFAILYNNGTEDTKSVATVDKIDGTTVTITFTIPASLANNTACTIVYPASAAKADNSGADVATALAKQDGTIENCPEVRVGTATIDKDNHSLKSVTKLEAQNAIFKFTLSGQSIDATHPLVIKKGENDVVTTVTPASSMTSVYVAMPLAASSTYRFIVTTDNNKYIKSGTAAITASKYYQTTLDLSTARYPLAFASATVDDLGSVIASDGNIYLKNAATPSGNTAVAVIAYVGAAGSVDASNASYKGLAIALSDANSGNNCKWAESLANCLNGIGGQTNTIATALGFKNGITCTNTLTADGHSSHNHTAAAASNNGTTPPSGTSGWFMPSMGQWNLIVQGLATKKAGSAVTTDLTTSVNNTYKADNLNSVITDAGGTGFKTDSYWASTEATLAGAWVMHFNGYAQYFSKTTNRYVRSVIAF